ncbi:hypothetical protein ABG768_023103 [Culter alburnus]|uniref:Uncharacterized protein n=1 Tax=Culter alburnus TaxID=194366 RepID=A0AAW2AMV7_CULAL
MTTARSVTWRSRHFITSDFKLKSNVLTTAMFPHDEAKTAENIRKELQKQLVSVLKFEPSVMSKVVWVTDQGSNIVAALRPYRRLDCQDHIYNTVLRHALDITELSVTVPEVAGTLLADVYAELREKLESRGEAQRMADVSPDVLDFLVGFLHPFYEAQRELEGDQYPTLNLVVLWHERLKHHCQPVSTDMPYQATIRQRHLEWIGLYFSLNAHYCDWLTTFHLK